MQISGKPLLGFIQEAEEENAAKKSDNCECFALQD